MTDSSSTDPGVIYVLWKRFETQIYPRALELKKKVDAGESVSDDDLEFLARTLSDWREIEPLLDRHPEYRPLVEEAFALYNAIADRAAENERRKS